MHAAVEQALLKWYQANQEEINNAAVADLGSYNINGGTKQIIKHAIGFDLLAGAGVDVVVEPGNIPEQYHHEFKFVTCISAYQFCPEPDLYMIEFLQLLTPHGYLFLTCCGEGCKFEHSTSGAYGYKDHFRMNVPELESTFGEYFDCLELLQLGGSNDDLIYIGQLSSGVDEDYDEQ